MSFGCEGSLPKVVGYWRDFRAWWYLRPIANLRCKSSVIDLKREKKRIYFTKGQLISECSFWNFKFSKNPPKIWRISALESKRWSNHKIKALSYNIWSNLLLKCIKDVIECLYLMIWSLFRYLGQKSVKFFGGFLENLKFQKDILKLSNL